MPNSSTVGNSANPLSMRVPGSFRHQITHSISRRPFLLWGASGYSMASRLPEQVLRVIYEREKDSAEGVATVPSWQVLRKYTAQVRQDGYATSSGQRHDGSHAIAAPVVGNHETLIGSVGIALPSSRQQADKTQQFVALVTSAASQLSLVARSAHFLTPVSS